MVDVNQTTKCYAIFKELIWLSYLWSALILADEFNQSCYGIHIYWSAQV